MPGTEQMMKRLGAWPLRIALALAVIWGVGAGLMFAFARTEQAWMVFIGGYQTILLTTAVGTVLRGTLLRRGEWNRAILLGLGMMAAVTTLYLLTMALTAAPVPRGLVELPNGAAVQRKPDLLLVAPGFYLASLGVGALLGPGFLLFSPARWAGPRRPRALRAPAAAVPPPLYRATGNPFHVGLLETRAVLVDDGAHGAPAPLTIYAPAEDGEYPVVLFQHGFLVDAGSFAGLLRHLASHGFVVVAPQMYSPRGLPVGKPSSLAEAELAEQIIEWLPAHLGELAGVRARFDRLGLAGHSRGAKVAWWLVRGGHTTIRSVAGVDPVDGAKALSGDPRVLTGECVISIPALVIGTELGPVIGSLTPACAPTGSNHVQFFQSCGAAAWHVLLRGHGHLDMLDEAGESPFVRRRLCAGGPDRAGARRTTAGLLAAFFRGTLQGEASALDVLRDVESAPVAVTSEWKQARR
jgi:chlorophyllase